MVFMHDTLGLGASASVGYCFFATGSLAPGSQPGLICRSLPQFLKAPCEKFLVEGHPRVVIFEAIWVIENAERASFLEHGIKVLQVSVSIRALNEASQAGVVPRQIYDDPF